MGESTRGDGSGDDPNIVDLSKFKAKKEALEIETPENPPETKADSISAGRARARGKALKVIRLKPNRSVFSMPKPGPKKIKLDKSIKKTIQENKKRAKYLAEAKTARIPGLHPDTQEPIKVISGGEVTEVQPQTLVDRDDSIKRRGQEKLYPVALLHQEEFKYIEDRISIEDAVEELTEIAARLQEEDPYRERGAKPVITQELFDEVALVLLKMFGNYFNGYLNDLRVESCCRMVLWDEPAAKMHYQLTFIKSRPVS